MNHEPKKSLVWLAVLLIFTLQAIQSQNVLSPAELMEIKSLSDLQISPDGSQVLYSVSAARGPNEPPGGAHRTYWRMNISDGSGTPLFEEGVDGSSPRWHPDGIAIGFLHEDEGGTVQVWALPAGGGDILKLTQSVSDVTYFRWNTGGEGLAYLAGDPVTAREKELADRGYGFIFYEENLKNTNLYVVELDSDMNYRNTRQLTEGVNVWDFEFNRQGTQIAASISPKNLIDHRYMFRRIHLIDIISGDMEEISGNEGKLGNYAFSPDGNQLAYTAALNINDHKESQVFVVGLKTGGVSNLTPENFKGHFSWVNWKDDNTLLCFSEEGTYPKLNLVPVGSKTRVILLDSEKSGIVFGKPVHTAGLGHIAFTGSTPADPGNIYYWDGRSDLRKITDINPRLREKEFGKQEVIRYAARDGQEIDGLLIYPVGYKKREKYPLVVYVHGGPESHHSNSWLSSYSRPGQVLAGKGYMVLFLNYRASTGYGVDFAMEGFMDPAGKEFDDIADGIEYMIGEKGVDPERVGLAGGSYGGYASGWFATYYTRYVKAVCMWAGISDIVSKRGTTDIPYEELYVHSGKKLEEQWQMNLERSPVYWAHQSKTATLIYCGAEDTRVHPSQSMELYRRMKMNDHPAVRLVQYPGEPHGARKQVSRYDILYRQIGWLDWYVRDLKPLDGPMPPLDISEQYGLDWDLKFSDE